MNELNYVIDKTRFIDEIYPNICLGHQYIPSVLPQVKRLIILGDIHGDYYLLIKMLLLAKVISVSGNDIRKWKKNIKWIGQATYVVQVGDQIDSCRPNISQNMLCTNKSTTKNDEAFDIEILKLCTELHNQAQKKGGAFISLLGNHEIMNASGEFSYVSYENMKEFENYKDSKKPNKLFSDGSEARKHAFKPGNEFGKLLGCTRLPAVIIGSHLFVHAGIIDGLIEELELMNICDLEIINIAIRMWLLNLLDKKYINNIIKGTKTSMFWTRILGNIPPNVHLKDPRCINHIGKVLKLFKINDIVVGHTPQSFLYSDDINQTCSGKVWRVDNGSSSAFDKFDNDAMFGNKKYSRRAQILEIIDDTNYFIIDNISRRRVYF